MARGKLWAYHSHYAKVARLTTQTDSPQAAMWWLNPAGWGNLKELRNTEIFNSLLGVSIPVVNLDAV
jgi:hypothetical protein